VLARGGKTGLDAIGGYPALLLAGFVLIALALRLPSFNDSLYGDELTTNFDLYGFGVGGVLHLVEGNTEGTPPLFFLLTYLTKGLGHPEGERVISLIAGLASIPLIYLLGLRTVGRQAATVAAALLVFSSFQIYYATTARAYALVMFFTLLASVTLLLALDTGRLRWWVAYALSNAAAAYTHYTALFVLAGLFLWAFLAHPEARRPLLLSVLGAAVLFAPWLGQLSADSGGPAAKINEALIPFNLHNVRHQLGLWAISNPNSTIRSVPGDLGLSLIAFGVLVGLVGSVARLVAEQTDWRPSRGLVLVLVLALATPVGAALHNIFFPSIFNARNLICSWPGFALLLGALVTAPRPPIRWVASAVLVAGFAVGGIKMLNRDQQRPEYDAAAAFIEGSGTPGAPVVDYPAPTPGPQMAMEAALAPVGDAVPPDRPALELARASIAARLEDRRRNGSGFNRLLPAPPDQELARRAVDLAGGGTIFLVVPGDATLPLLQRQPGHVAAFLGSLPANFHETRVAHFPGFFPISVHVLERAPQ
jgi:hypothetical protein